MTLVQRMREFFNPIEAPMSEQLTDGDNTAPDPTHLNHLAQSVHSLAHSPIGPSSAHRYLKCPASVQASHNIPDESSPLAMEGTAAHELCEQCLLDGTDAWEHAGEQIGVEDHNGELVMFDVDDDMIAGVQMFLDYCRPFGPDRDAGTTQWTSETRVVADSVHPLLSGRVDFNAVHFDSRELHVVDFKYGAGIVVEATGNPQGRIYALGTIDDLLLKLPYPAGTDNRPVVETIHITIVQPRAHHMDGPIRTEVISIYDLNGWVNDVLKPGIEAVKYDTENFQSGSWCRFCPRRATCIQLAVDVMGPIDAISEGITAKDLDTETIQEFLAIKERFGILEKAISKEALNRITSGTKIAGYKLAKTNSHRVWKRDAQDAFDLMYEDDECFEPRKLKSPAQLEKMSPHLKEFAKEHAFKPEGGFTIVPEDDNREGISRDAADIFKI